MNTPHLKVDWTVRFYDLVIIAGAIIIALANFFSTKSDIRNLETSQQAYHQEFLTAEANRDKLDAVQLSDEKADINRIEQEMRQNKLDIIQSINDMTSNLLAAGELRRKTTSAQTEKQQDAFENPRHRGN